jgi:hypothetical protein
VRRGISEQDKEPKLPCDKLPAPCAKQKTLKKLCACIQRENVLGKGRRRQTRTLRHGLLDRLTTALASIYVQTFFASKTGDEKTENSSRDQHGVVTLLGAMKSLSISNDMPSM